MNPPAARDALTSSVKRVNVNDRAGFATPSVFAVFETDEPDAALMGLVTLEQAGRFSQRIFADLLPQHHGNPVLADADLETVSVQMQAAATGVLPVLDNDGHLLGAVTRESLWAAMLSQQRTLLAELGTREAQQRAMLNAIPDELLCVSAEGKLVDIRRAGDAPVDAKRDGAVIAAFDVTKEEPAHGTVTNAATSAATDGAVPEAAGTKGTGPSAVGRRLMESTAATGKGVSDVFPPEVAAALKEGIQHSLTSGTATHASFSIPGPEITSHYEARFVSFGDGNVLIICRDVTEVNALRAKLVMSDRMVSIGTLASGIAHEINNPLTYISANLVFLEEMLAPMMARDPRLCEATPLLDDMRDGVDRVQRTVGDLKLFSRGEDPSRAVVELKDMLARVIRIATSEIRHRATLTLDLGAVPPVQGSDGQLGQVFLNLLVNAAQSIKEGAADRNEIRVVTRTDQEGRAVVEIHDTGSGIPEEIKTRIFAPFFTTKGVGGGTGLGLSICHGIVNTHGGEIEVESAVGKGSIFRVVLPASSGRSPATPQRPVPGNLGWPA